MVYFSVLFAEAVNGFLFKFVVFSTILVVYYLNEPFGVLSFVRPRASDCSLFKFNQFDLFPSFILC